MDHILPDHTASLRLRRNHLLRRRGKKAPINWKLWLKSRYEMVKTSMFFSPALAILAAIVLGIALSYVDSYLSEQDIDPPAALTTTVDSARALLSTVAGATISFAGTAFSVSLLVIQLGSSQYTPRIVHTLFKDPFNRRIVAFVVGTFTYCLVVMRSVDARGGFAEPDDPPIVPHISVSVAVILGILSVVLIVAFIDHSANTMDVSQLLERVTRDTIMQITRTWAEDDPDNQEEEEYDNSGDNDKNKTLKELKQATLREIEEAAELEGRSNHEGDNDDDSYNEENEDNPKKPKSKKGEESQAEALNKCHVVRFRISGWVQEIDMQALLNLVPDNGYIKLHTLAGRYAIPGAAICSVYPKPTLVKTKDNSNESSTSSNSNSENGDDDSANDSVLEDFDEDVLDTVMIGLSRSARSDPAYGLRQLVDVVLRALSPGVNDPTTAQDGIFHIAAVVTEFLQRVPPPSVMAKPGDAKGKLILNEQHDYDSIVRLGFDEARICASSSPTVAVYLLEALRLIRDSLIAAGRPRRAPEIERQARLVEESILNASHLQEDQEIIIKARRHRFNADYGSMGDTERASQQQVNFESLGVGRLASPEVDFRYA